MNSITISLNNRPVESLRHEIAQRLSPYSNNSSSLDISKKGLAITNDKSFEKASLEISNGFLILIGEINNLETLKTLSATDGGHISTLSDIELIDHLLSLHGKMFAQYFEGSYALIKTNYLKSQVSVFIGNVAQMPMFYVKGSIDYLTTEIKSVSSFIPLKLKSFSDLNLQNDLGYDHVILKNVERLPSGCWSNFEEGRWINNDQGCFLDPKDHQINMSSIDAGDYFGKLLFNSVDECLRSHNGNIHATLSSGLDSALIVGVASQLNHTLDTCSIGTREVNEFDGAQETAQQLGHEFFTIETEQRDWMEGYLDAIYYNEIYDGLSAEIQAPLACLYRALEDRADVLLSGYGADLLSAGMLSPSTPVNKINPTCAASIRRTMWTLEFSPFLAKKYGINVRFPFWTTPLIQLAMSIPAEVKIVDGEVKSFLRNWSIRKHILPENIARRPKLAVHEGCGVDSYFNNLLRMKQSDGYRKKDAFAYQIYTEYFINGLPREAIDKNKLEKIINVSRRFI